MLDKVKCTILVVHCPFVLRQLKMTSILFSVKEVLRLPQLSVRKGQSPHAVSNGRMRHVGMALLWKTLGYLFYPAGITTWFSGV